MTKGKEWYKIEVIDDDFIKETYIEVTVNGITVRMFKDKAIKSAVIEHNGVCMGKYEDGAFWIQGVQINQLMPQEDYDTVFGKTKKKRK